MGHESPQTYSRRGAVALFSLGVAGLGLVSLFSQSALTFAQAPQASKHTVTGFQLTSTAFDADSAIPSKYSCSGGNVSPALAWTEPPAGTQSFALIVDDPDASAAAPAVHWLIYSIPASTRFLPEGVATKPTLPDKSRQGKNSAGKVGYRGPCPDPGKVHHYFFKLYALDYVPSLRAKTNIAELESAIKDHALGTAELIGRFQRE